MLNLLPLNLLERSDYIYICQQAIYLHIQLRHLELNHFFPTIICSHFLKSFVMQLFLARGGSKELKTQDMRIRTS